MQIIINFPNISASSVEDAKEKVKGEYYNRPHTWASGFSRYFREDGKMIGMSSGANQYVDGLPWEMPDEFWSVLWAARRDDGVADDWISGKGDHIGGGYNAAIIGDRVVWETYHACSGNFAGVRYHADGSATLFVDSARHGIPFPAGRFQGLDGEILLYNSLRTDCQWWECGLEHPDEIKKRKQEENEKNIPGWKYQELGEELEARIA